MQDVIDALYGTQQPIRKLSKEELDKKYPIYEKYDSYRYWADKSGNQELHTMNQTLSLVIRAGGYDSPEYNMYNNQRTRLVNGLIAAEKAEEKRKKHIENMKNPVYKAKYEEDQRQIAAKRKAREEKFHMVLYCIGASIIVGGIMSLIGAIAWEVITHI